MSGPVSLDHYKEALLFLSTAGVVVPLFRRLQISPVIGFLGAGILLGPWGLGQLASRSPIIAALSFTEVEQMAVFAEFGVVFLLFMIGLELSFERLNRLRRLVFGLGAMQVVSCAIAIAAVAMALGETGASAGVIGGALALSSTAIAIPVMAERKRLRAAAGRAAFSVLLFQDLMVAPLLLMIAVLGSRENAGLGSGVLYAVLPGVIGLVVIVGVGRLVLRPLFRQVAVARSSEFFMAACLLVVIGTSVLAAAVGLSMTLGAFIAGLLLAETEYRRQVEVTIEPFKGLLLGLFFVSMGAGLDMGRLFGNPVRIIGIAVGFVALKIVLIWASARIAGLPGAVSREIALVLGPGGEFALVMFAAALAAGVIPLATGADLMVATTLSMIAIPALGTLAARLVPPNVEIDLYGLRNLAPPEAGLVPVIIAGYGRVGALVGDLLTRHQIPFVAIDGDARLVAHEREAGKRIYWGNASDPDFLRRCGIAQARGLVVTMDNPAAVEQVVSAGRYERADLVIVARARDAIHARHLYEMGATDAIPETIEASLQLSESLLVDIGVPMGHVIASIHEKRDEFRAILQEGNDAARPRRGVKAPTRAKAAAKSD
ncbi:MAG: cation:proton antiporter [Beijerinckiaceae bacterium]|jgi:monovalent cation:H+ antiporter-2, CPA2 family|nr:cation:proton antiporter [Beijerinckiaceae bacterium]